MKNFTVFFIHETRPQLLFEYGGRTYSYNHKETSDPMWHQQDALSGTTYPEAPNEIDLMKYAEDDEPEDYRERVILAEKDALGLIWLSKIKIISLFLLFFFISCWIQVSNATFWLNILFGVSKLNLFRGLLFIFSCIS